MRNAKEGESPEAAGKIKSLWRHDFREPNWCKGVFSYAPGELTRLVFPAYVSGEGKQVMRGGEGRVTGNSRAKGCGNHHE